MTFYTYTQNNNFITWPELTTELIQKNLEPQIVRALGHLNQERKKLQSTKQVEAQPVIDCIQKHLPQVKKLLPKDIPTQQIVDDPTLLDATTICLWTTEQHVCTAVSSIRELLFSLQNLKFCFHL